MSEQISPEDAAMLAELRAVVDHMDAVPPDVVAAAKASFIWRTVDAELAELTFDSLVDADAGVLVRGGDQPRLLTFQAGPTEVEVEATRAGRAFRLLGQIVPAAAGELTVRHPNAAQSVAVDELGRFVVDAVSPGSVSFEWQPAVGPRVSSEWITL